MGATADVTAAATGSFDVRAMASNRSKKISASIDVLLVLSPTRPVGLEFEAGGSKVAAQRPPKPDVL
jgi:hypothetical protein